jgi:3-hydroxyisobutyrate dehydrogenase
MSSNDLDPRIIALIGFGEAGQALGRGLCAQGGWRGTLRPGDNAPRRVIAIDTALDADARGRALGETARALEIAIEKGYAEALREADLVLCAVPGDSALDAARAAAPLLKPGAIYLDLCTVTGRMADEDRAAIETGAGCYLDIAVMGSFNSQGYKAPLLLAGADAIAVAGWMTALGFRAEVLGPKPGSASAVKMLRSVIMKGFEALAIESFVAARRQGILEEVLGCFGDVDRVPLRDFLANLACTHMVHVRRRWEEMGLVAETLRETGVEPLMTEATTRSLRRTIDAGVIPSDGKVPPLDETLRVLDERVVR